MFEELSAKLDKAFRLLQGRGKLTERNIKDGLREVRRALLEADVNYRVAKNFIASVEQKALGQEVLKSITPGQQLVKLVHDQMVVLLGSVASPFTLSDGTSVIMLVGLQGSGKTTVAGKLARRFSASGLRPLLVAADVNRPAAVNQLQVLGDALALPVFASPGEVDPVRICSNAVKEAGRQARSPVIIDTAGRLHVDEEMMRELAEIKEALFPHQTILVLDAMTGQDAVGVASEFEGQLGVDGFVLTKLDGDARGGAALSIRAVTGKPIFFVGLGEKLDALEPFHPDRIAARILGMGDIVSLVERAEAVIESKEAEELERKLRKRDFTLEDFLDQLHQLKKMGPLEALLEMVPGWRGKGLKIDDRALVKVEAIMNSMTLDERRRPSIIDGSRRRRIARGSGTSPQDVNRLLRQFDMMRKMFKQVSKKGLRGFEFPDF